MAEIDVTPQVRRAFEGIFRDIKRYAIRAAQREAALSTVTTIQGFPVDPTPPTVGQVLTFDGTKWTPT